MTTGHTLDQRYLTAPEIAAWLGMQESGVRHWLATGKLRGYQPGGRRLGWRVSEADLRSSWTSPPTIEGTGPG